MTKEEKFNDNNYKIWHKMMLCILNTYELLDIINNAPMAKLDEGNITDHRREQEAYQTFLKKNLSAYYMLLSYMLNDLMGDYEQFTSAKIVWDQLRFDLGGTSTTRHQGLILKFETYSKNPKQMMTEHLRVISSMIHQLKDAGQVLTNEQQVQVVIRSLPDL